MGAIFMSVWYKLAGDGTHKLPVSGQALYHETVALVTQGGGQLSLSAEPGDLQIRPSAPLSDGMLAVHAVMVILLSAVFLSSLTARREVRDGGGGGVSV